VYLPGKAFISEDANAEKRVENEDVIARAPLLTAKLAEGALFPGSASCAEAGVSHERTLGSSHCGQGAGKATGLPLTKPLDLNHNCFNTCNRFCSRDRNEQATHCLHPL